MFGGENSDSIPIDLVIEIFLSLPIKSIGKCRCVSKKWRSMLRSSYFTESFLTRSLALPPRLLFAVERDNNREWSFFSSPQPQNLYDEKSSSLVVTADFHSTFHGDYCGHASGLTFFRQYFADRAVICNPSTGQYADLPLRKGGWSEGIFLGFDPVDKQFKILCINFPDHNEKKEHSWRKIHSPYQILTLGKKYSWRKIHCPLNHSPSGERICINGVLYYLASPILGSSSLIVCFDVRSEEFKFINIDFVRDWGRKLINYKGKLGMITIKHDYENDDYPTRYSIKLCMWVIKDVEKPESSEWSEYFSTSWVDEWLFIVGVTATGEIVLKTYSSSKPFNVIYLNPERNTRQSVEIRGFGDNHKVRSVVVIADYVEDLKFVTIRPPEQKRTFDTINKFDYLRLVDDEDDNDLYS